jgi:chromate transport protein ChrA
MESKKSNVFVSLGLHIIGFLLCILPPALCTLNYFPIWREMGYESCIAGGGALLIALCAIPLYKLLRKWLESFSSYIMWLLLFLLFFGMSRIADQMTVISLVGFIGNLLGAICFFIAKRLNKIRKSEED